MAEGRTNLPDGSRGRCEGMFEDVFEGVFEGLFEDKDDCGLEGTVFVLIDDIIICLLNLFVDII
jgi:hypothetical protein